MIKLSLGKALPYPYQHAYYSPFLGNCQ
jgi:hypothetical protein